MPTPSQFSYVLRRQQSRRLRQVCARIESEPASTTILSIDWVDILEVLTLVLEHASILETGAVLQFCNIATKNTGSASVQAAHEHILAVTFILVLHSRYSCFIGSSSVLAECRVGASPLFAVGERRR